jgi:hypothetical protein
MPQPAYQKLVAIAFKNWTLDHCKWVYSNTQMVFDPNGNQYKSTLPQNVAKYVALKKFGVSLCNPKTA